MNSTDATIKAVNTTIRPRPLSPHLQVYRWLITSTLSILHRLTGVALSAGLAYLSMWLIYGAYYPEQYDDFMRFAASPLGIIILAGWSIALNYHFCNGIRHLFWDMGRGFELHNVTYTGFIVLAATLVLTAIEWAFGLGYINI